MGADSTRGVCPRCSVEGDRGEKTLHRCRLCGGYFCERHSEPRLVMSFQAYQAYVAEARARGDGKLASLLVEEWRKRDGHPCPDYTREFWRRYKEGLEPPPRAPAEAGWAAGAPVCERCGREIAGPSYVCKFCGGVFCAEHFLPERHGCRGLGRPPSEGAGLARCGVCGATGILFRCSYCGGLFCARHHLPPNHDCPNIHLWRGAPPPGLTVRYSGERYAAVDVPVAPEPPAAAAGGYSPQPDAARPYTQERWKVPVEGGDIVSKALEGVKRVSKAVEEELGGLERLPAHKRGESPEDGRAARLLQMFVVFLVTFIFSLSGLLVAPDAYVPVLFPLTLASLAGTVVTFLLLRWR